MEPDMQMSRIRLFGRRLRYVMVAGRMRGCGSGYPASSRSISAYGIHAMADVRAKTTPRHILRLRAKRVAGQAISGQPSANVQSRAEFVRITHNG
jgi:hypothetical protein